MKGILITVGGTSWFWVVFTWNFVPPWTLGVDREYIEKGIEICELNLKRTQKCKVEISFIESRTE